MFDEPGMKTYEVLDPILSEMVNSPMSVICLRHKFALGSLHSSPVHCVKCRSSFVVNGPLPLEARTDGVVFHGSFIPPAFGIEYLSGEGSWKWAVVAKDHPLGGLML